MLQYTGASVVLAEDQEQVDKLYEIRSEIPHVRYVIYEDEKGMRGYKDPWLLSFAEVLERGREHRRKHPDAVERLLLRASPEEVCHLSSTSGTTGRPKAAMLRHRNLIHMGVALQEVDPLLPTDDYLSFLPLAWIGEQMMSVAMALTGGFAVNFPEEVETALQDLKEIGPHVMFSPRGSGRGSRARSGSASRKAPGSTASSTSASSRWGTGRRSTGCGVGPCPWGFASPTGLPTRSSSSP